MRSWGPSARVRFRVQERLILTEKVCRCCGVTKSLDEFSFRRDSGEYRPTCKPCRSTVQSAARYGVTVGDIERIKEDQGNRCAICKTHADDIPHASFKHNPLVIDHCHTTGQVRGLLCPTCNVMLGHAKDNVALLSAAITYLSS